MGLLDKAKRLLEGNKDKVAQGVDKATDVVDSKTGSKHTDTLNKVDKAAADYAGKPDPSAPNAATPAAAAPGTPPPDAHPSTDPEPPPANPADETPPTDTPKTP